jgi:hypothetical protein
MFVQQITRKKLNAMKKIKDNTEWHKATLLRIFDIVQSCGSIEQLNVAQKMLQNYKDNFSTKNSSPEIDTLYSDIQEYCKLTMDLMVMDEKDLYEANAKNN